jgi:hypothetical protein
MAIRVSALLDDAFLEKLLSLLKEIPRARRFADRPSFKVVLADAGKRAHRDAVILKACHEFGYSGTSCCIEGDCIIRW